MRRVPGSAAVFGFAAGLLSLVVAAGSGVPSASPAAAADESMIARGRYLANFTCVECHSERTADRYSLDPAKLFAGGEEFAGPWGAVYSKNITSDMETGIGSWSEADIKRAITQGVAKDGTKLLLMPWQSFRGMADEDVSAIAAYLKTVPAVKHQVPAAKLAPAEAVGGFIGSIPPLKAVVPASLYADPRSVFHDFVFGGDPATSSPPPPSGYQAPQGKDSVEAGRYLVNNVLACRDCHAGNLAGGTPPFFAPNITPDRTTGIGSWNKEQIVKLLREGIEPDGSRVNPIMPAGALAYGRLTDDDVYNVVAYLKSIPPVQRAAGQPNPAMPAPPPGPPGGAPTALPKTGDTAPWSSLAAALAVVGAGVLGFGLRLARRRS